MTQRPLSAGHFAWQKVLMSGQWKNGKNHGKTCGYFRNRKPQKVQK